jgi:hypothetical protein
VLFEAECETGAPESACIIKTSATSKESLLFSLFEL